MLQTPPPMAPPGIPFDTDMVVGLLGTIGIIFAAAFALRWLLHSPIGEALAEGIRLRRQRRYGVAGDSGEAQRLESLEEHVRQLSSQVSELGERLDFAERVLAERRDRRLGAGQ